MSRNSKMFKRTVIIAIAILVAVATTYTLVLHPDYGIINKGALNLSWEKPAETVDGSPLTDLAGYTIHCWNAELQETETIVIEDPQITSYDLDHLWPGTYQCAISAAAHDGSQSVLSNVVSKTVP